MKLPKSLIKKFHQPKAPIPDLWIPPKIDINNLPKIDDPEAAIKAIRTAQDTAIINEGVLDGEPFTLASWMWLAEWQMWGLRDPDGLRSIRDVSIIIPKKNAKSPWMARLAIFFAGLDNEPGAKIAIVANSSDQANNIWDPLLYSVENHPGLEQRFKPFYSSPNHIEYYAHGKRGGVIWKRTGDAKGKQGKNWHAVLADEISEWEGEKGWKLWRTYTRGAQRAREQPMSVTATTGNVYQEGSFYQSRRAQTVDAIANPGKYKRFLAIFYGPTAEQEKNLRAKVFPSAEVVRSINPGVDEVFPLGRLMEEIELAFKSEDSTQWPDILRYAFNLDISAIFQWMKAHLWAVCDFGPIDLEKMDGCDVSLGVDMSAVEDTTSTAFIFHPKKPGDKVKIVVNSYLPEERVKIHAGLKESVDKDGKAIPVRRDAARYIEWAEQGYLTITDGRVGDDKAQIDDIVALGDMRDTDGKVKFNIRAIGYDPNLAKRLVTDLKFHGYNSALTPLSGQYGTYNEACADFMKHVIREDINHAGNPFLAWAFHNLTMQNSTAGEIKPVKLQTAQRIDPAVATLLGWLCYFGIREPE